MTSSFGLSDAKRLDSWNNSEVEEDSVGAKVAEDSVDARANRKSAAINPLDLVQERQPLPPEREEMDVLHAKNSKPGHVPTNVKGAKHRSNTAIFPESSELHPKTLRSKAQRADPSFKGPIENLFAKKAWQRGGSPNNTDQLQAAAAGMRQRGWVIDPRKSRFMPVWDIIMLLAMLFTALYTPYEISFIENGDNLYWRGAEGELLINPGFMINRFVDLLFITDILLTLNMAYQEKLELGGHWVYNKPMIIKNYLQGWFVIDVGSVLPFWIVGLTSEPAVEESGLATVANISGTGSDAPAGGSNKLLLARLVRLLRMLKLARVLKASRVLQRHLLDLVMGYFEMTYAVLKMIKLVVWLIFFAHWQACLWGLISSFMADAGQQNWLSEFRADWLLDYQQGLVGYRKPGAADAYAAALYWSIMTLTSIGYGQMLPVNTAERFLCSTYMMLSGVMWTYAIGNFAGIVTTLDPNGVLFQNTMDALNYFMRERGLPAPMRITLREYFQNARRVHQITDDTELLDRLSPLLQGTVALAANKRWLDKVWFFRSLGESREGREFIASLAKTLVIRAYVAHERLPIGQLYVLRRGLVVKLWRFLGTGKVWGEDMILDTPELIDHSQAVALTYVEAFTLRRNDLDECMADYPLAYKRVRKAARRITMQRALLKYLCETVEGRPVRSFATRSSARGFTEVRSGLTVEQKIDMLIKDLDERKASMPNKPKKGGLGGHFLKEEAPSSPPPSPPQDGGGGRSGGENGETAAAIGRLAASMEAANRRHDATFTKLADQLQALTQQVAAIQAGSSA